MNLLIIILISILFSSVFAKDELAIVTKSKGNVEYKSDSYSFTHNFFSDLGSFKTNPHEKDPNVEKKDKLFS